MSYQVRPSQEVGPVKLDSGLNPSIKLIKYRPPPDVLCSQHEAKQQPLKTFVYCLCRHPLGEFLRAHRDGGHRPRFPPLLRHPSPEVPGEPSDPGGRLPEVPRGRHPQAHYRERLAGTLLLL